MCVKPFTEKDYSSLYDFMKPLWLETYGEILPQKQILLLLDKYFSPNAITQFREKGYEYKRLGDGGVLIFVERENEVFMDKLYLQPHLRGKGYATLAFSEMEKRGKDIVLAVNRKNLRALSAYKKNGFVIEKEGEVDLGNGMINYDYIMRKKASAR